VDINRIKRILEQKDSECQLRTTELKIANRRLAEIEQELEMKSGENNRLRRSCTDMEQAMKDLYKSRKG
jgi:chromosome segregation ATPase